MNERFESGHFIGRVQGARQVCGLTLAETVYTPGLHVPSHAHDHALCSFVLDGSFTERLGRASASCERGSLIFHPRDEPHAHDFGRAGGRCFNLQFGAQWVARLEELGLREPGHPADFHGGRAAWLAGQLYREFCTPDSASILSIEGFALALLGEVARSRAPEEPAGAQPAWLRRAVQHLHAHFQEAVSLTDLARQVEVDPSHLARTFREHFRCTMSEYIRKLRVEHARHELLASDRPLSAIAYTAGFADQAHFSRVFRQLTGVTPAEFRRLARTR